jgi:hypothetical protein
MMVDGLELFKKNNLDNKYTHCLLTRPDLYFYKKFNLDRLDIDKINFGWTHELNHNCDNFILMKSESVEKIIKNLKESWTHELTIGLNNEVNYISRPISSHGDQVQPDFYVIFRNIERFKNGEFIID